MQWILLLICFINTAALAQTNKNSVLDKLKKTDQLMGKNHNKIQRGTTGQSVNPDRKTVYNKMKQYGPQEIIIPDNRERVVITLRQDNMPCIVPNMKLFKTMPNVGDVAILQNPIDPGIYVPGKKTQPLEKIEP